jgi:ketosteroid isomerase-like protein
VSQENVELVRRAYEAMNERDFSRIGEFLDPDVEFDVSRNALNPGIYRGHGGFERMVRATDEIWDDFRIDPHDFVDAGDHVVAGITISGSGSGSGVVAEMSLFNVVTVRAGKIVRVVGGLSDRAEALAVAGLGE